MNFDPDLQAEFGRLMASAAKISSRTHASREIDVFESEPEAGRLWRFLCLIDDRGRVEGMLSLPDGALPTLTGTLITNDRKLYTVRVEKFAGGPTELLDMACRLLDYKYEFPADSGVSGPDALGVTT